MSARVPATRVESKSISVATHQARSVGQNRFGDWAWNRVGSSHQPKLVADCKGPVKSR